MNMKSVVKKAEALARSFYKMQLKFKSEQDAFNEQKAMFSRDMEALFKDGKFGKSVVFDCDCIDSGKLVINRIQRVDIQFDADALEKALGSEAKGVIVKRYEIIDIDGLIAYLKTCNVSPKIFKRFVSVTKYVNEKELDKLESLGKISAEQVEGCYTLKEHKPYFTVDVRRGRDGEQKR